MILLMMNARIFFDGHIINSSEKEEIGITLKDEKKNQAKLNKRLPCTNNFQHPSSILDLPSVGQTKTISTFQYEGDYSVVQGVTIGMLIKFEINNIGDEITVRSGTRNGAIIASGNTPLTFSSTYAGTIFVHWNLQNCGKA